MASRGCACVRLQFLESYKSVTLESMASAFDVSSAFLDSELVDFICAGRLHAKIDKVAGVIETNRWVGGWISLVAETNRWVRFRGGWCSVHGSGSGSCRIVADGRRGEGLQRASVRPR
jgi:hypothetical protein